MRILILADGRSPIAKNWLASVKKLGHEVIFVSSYPCKKPEGADLFHVLPIAFSALAGSRTSGAAMDNKPPKFNLRRLLIGKFRNLLLKFRYVLGPLSLPFYGLQLRRIADQTRPDLIHALRIPYEGMTLSFYGGKVPCAISIWGNDITLHAKNSREMKSLTRRTLEMASGLAADSARDIRLGCNWGFNPAKPTAVLPGNGGIDFTKLRIQADLEQAKINWLPSDWHIVINPRGFRPGSVRNDTFFQSIPLVLRQLPNTLFLCCSMQGQPEALEWIESLHIQRNTLLLPTIPQETLWGLFQRAAVNVNVSQHDGTPNSLLEAMACGCFPIAGDIESIREWITPGINGILIDPDSPEQLASAVINALLNERHRQTASDYNRKLIRRKAEAEIVQTEIEIFYNQVLASTINKQLE